MNKTEEMKEFFNECITKDLINSEDLAINYMKVAKDYIKQLESKEQKLIEKIEEKEELCYICKDLKEKGKYIYSKVPYTSIAIEKGKNGKYRCFAWGEGEASISCNYCPHCGRKLN